MSWRTEPPPGFRTRQRGHQRHAPGAGAPRRGRLQRARRDRRADRLRRTDRPGPRAGRRAGRAPRGLARALRRRAPLYTSVLPRAIETAAAPGARPARRARRRRPTASCASCTPARPTASPGSSSSSASARRTGTTTPTSPSPRGASRWTGFYERCAAAFERIARAPRGPARAARRARRGRGAGDEVGAGRAPGRATAPDDRQLLDDRDRVRRGARAAAALQRPSRRCPRRSRCRYSATWKAMSRLWVALRRGSQIEV